LRNDFSPDLAWFDQLVVHMDLCYQGLKSNYSAKTVLIPFKRNKNEKELNDLKKLIIEN
jgi:hypothetical protein